MSTRSKTDKVLKAIERKLGANYKKSAKGVYKSWQKYMTEAEKKLTPFEKAYSAAKASGDKDAIRKAGAALSKAKKEVTLQNDNYKQMLNGVTRNMASVNQTAVEYVNGQMSEIYLMNFDADDIAAELKKVPAHFGLVDKATVKKRIMDGDIKLPKRQLAIPKDMAWNTKQINSSVLQGILQGEGMDKIAARLLPIINNNTGAAIRNARTLVTQTENGGRQDRYKQLKDDGVVLKKVWIATADDRTRESHLELDGVEVDVDDVFPNGLEYPGDPNGEPEEVYNCRCTMQTHVVGFVAEDGHIEYVEQVEEEESLHDEQIEKEKEKRDEKKRSKNRG